MQVRHDPRFTDFRPTTIHINYHSNKLERMRAVEKHYVDGVADALAPFTLES